MSIKVSDRGVYIFNESGKYLEISCETSSDVVSEQYVSIRCRTGDKVEITGVTVHDIVYGVLSGCSNKTKEIVRDWLSHEINKVI